MRDRINQAIDGDTDIDRLITYAYYVGQHDAAVRVCNRAKGIFDIQRQKARKIRYYKMAMKVQGNIDMIYDPDYSSDFSDWEMDGDYPKKY